MIKQPKNLQILSVFWQTSIKSILWTYISQHSTDNSKKLNINRSIIVRIFFYTYLVNVVKLNILVFKFCIFKYSISLCLFWLFWFIIFYLNYWGCIKKLLVCVGGTRPWRRIKTGQLPLPPSPANSSPVLTHKCAILQFLHKEIRHWKIYDRENLQMMMRDRRRSSMNRPWMQPLVAC